jgi:phage shock protein C
MARSQKRLYRTTSDRKVAGVLGGFAEYFDVEPSLTRIAYLVLTVLTGFVPGIFAYVAMTLIIPPEPDAEKPAPKSAAK